MEAYFPTYEEKWTKTPNLFFDDMLKAENTTLNEIRLVGYLIRQTLGYNKDAKWVGVTRSDLVSEAGISKSNITNALKNCEARNWILIYETGTGTKKERYIFLNDQRNIRIVAGLRLGYFKVSDLEYLNDAGVENLLNQHKIPAYPESGEEQKFSYPESGQDTYPESGQDTYPESGQDKEPSDQEDQGVSDPLKTSFKDNVLNTVVVMTNADVQKLFESIFNQKISAPSAKTILDAATEKGMKIEDTLDLTKKAELMELDRDKPVNNLVGLALKVIAGEWDFSKYKSKSAIYEITSTIEEEQDPFVPYDWVNAK